jgi:hypothetical protein
MEDGMTTTSILSRRTLVASAAALPALAVPAIASAAPARAGASTTLPPELIERFVRLRAWYLAFSERGMLHDEEIDRRFYAATGVTSEQYFDMKYGHPGKKELGAVRTKIHKEVPGEDDEDECSELCDERWDVARAMMAQTPRTIADLAYQMEAFLVADLEIIEGDAKDGGDWLVRMLLHHIRTLGALPLPENSFGSLHIDITEPARAEEDDVSEEHSKSLAKIAEIRAPDDSIATALATMKAADATIDGLIKQYGNDVDEHPEYENTLLSREAALNILADTESQSCLGMAAKAEALVEPLVVEDNDRHGAIAASFAQDWLRRFGGVSSV